MRSKGSLSSFAILTVLFFGLLFGYLHRDNLYDWWRLRDYQPSQAIAQLTSDDTMTDYARHMFYVNKPNILTNADFNQNCPDDGGEQTIILGCYHDKETGIYLYSVSDPKLAGVEQVTAAHETLHAIYDRLSSKEKAHVDGLLQDYYLHGLTDKRILATIKSYQKTEPNDIINEMHSVFGTEVSALPPALESYYSQYFSNRKQIAAFAQKYQQTFTNNQAVADNYLSQIKTIEQQLLTLKNQIDAQESGLRQRSQQIESDRQNVSDVSAFNSEVNEYNAQVQSYRGLIAQYNGLIQKHNDLVARYKSLTVETNQLIQELNSRSASVSAQ
ncbi:MAG: hypothetical protein ACXWLH_03800 [Candidatus Saccharimonadales bacterium]